MTNNIYLELKQLLKKSYSPYSRFATAAIAETDKGNFSGINIENASFSETICAERVAIFNAITNGAKKIKALYLISNSHHNNITPCGACRQVMSEFFATNTPIYVYNIDGKMKKYTYGKLSPCSFVKNNLK
jgi:cytidine deaminase